MPILHKRIVLIVLVLILAVVGIVTAEKIAKNQIINLQKTKTPVLAADETLGFKLKPNLSLIHKALGKNTPEIQINTTSQGFKDDRIYLFNKPPNSTRIMMLGDSFIQADEVRLNQSISKILELNLIKKYPDRNFEVINAAWRGSSTLQQYLWFKLIGSKFKPDIVVLNFYVGNDVDDLSMFETVKDDSGLAKQLVLKTHYIDTEGHIKRQTGPRRISGFFGRINQTLCDPSFLCKYYIRPGVDKLLTLVNLGKHYPPWSPTWFGFIWKNLSPEFSDLWSTTQSHIIALNRAVSNTGGTLVISIIPFGHQVYKSKWTKAKKVMSISELEDMYQNAYPQKRLIQLATENNIQIVDFLPSFKAHTGQETYFPGDMHWTPAGHQLAADILTAKLTSIEPFIAQNNSN